MRGRDEDDEFLGPSRSQLRRDALDVLALAEKLATLSDAQLERLPIPEGLLPHIVETRRMSSNASFQRASAARTPARRTMPGITRCTRPL